MSKVEVTHLKPGDPDFPLFNIYIAGPMRGKEYFNFPAFDEAKEKLKLKGWKPISPADLDREAGFDPRVWLDDKFKDIDLERNYMGDEDEIWCESPDGLQNAVKRDVLAILEGADAICLLPGWEQSHGAITEYMLSAWKGIPAFLYPSMEPVTLDQTYFAFGRKQAKEDRTPEDPLEEAIAITGGDRNNQYGPPAENHRRTAELWSTYLGTVRITARQVCVMNILQKISRDVFNPKRDNLVDMAGFVRNIWMVEEGLG